MIKEKMKCKDGRKREVISQYKKDGYQFEIKKVKNKEGVELVMWKCFTNKGEKLEAVWAIHCEDGDYECNIPLGKGAIRRAILKYA